MTDHRTAAETLLRRSKDMSPSSAAAGVLAAQAGAHALLAIAQQRPLIIAVSSDLDAEQAKALMDQLNAAHGIRPDLTPERKEEIMETIAPKPARKRAARKPKSTSTESKEPTT